MSIPFIRSLKDAVLFVALANLAYFGVEFGIAVSIHSVSLFADSIDFLEDASVNLLILLGLAWPARWRARLGMVLAALLLVPSMATLWTAWGKFGALSVPDPNLLSIAGLGALAVNVICAFALVRFRHRQGSLTKAAFLSARNDAYANIAIILAALLTLRMHSFWPDLVVGLGIAIINAHAALEVWQAARKEHLDAAP
ncbi:MAG: cobalt transporter [Hirschia sp.]|nr:cobalt transporter [Hirschia sp.]MBF16919.1 cobalt transporter [Hirschia sp.]